MVVEALVPLNQLTIEGVPYYYASVPGSRDTVVAIRRELGYVDVALVAP